MSTFSIRIFTLALMVAPLCSLGCGSGTSGSPTGGTVAHAGSGGGGSAAGGTTGTGSCIIDNSTVTAAAYPSGLALTKACSPYTVDDLVVKDGGVLTIEAGATLRFSDNTAIYVGQSGAGKLLINGTAQSPVTLTTQFNPPLAGGWYGLQFWQGTVSGSKVSYATVEYAGGNFDAAIVGQAGMPKNSVTLDHVAINSSDADGIMVVDSTSGFVVTNCTLDGAPYAGP